MNVLRRITSRSLLAACGLVLGFAPGCSLLGDSTEARRMPSGSMEPTLEMGEPLSVDVDAYDTDWVVGRVEE